MKYKKYILFGYGDCRKDGGVEDIRGSFDTHEEALDAESDGNYEISYVIDRDTWEEPVAAPSTPKLWFEDSTGKKWEYLCASRAQFAGGFEVVCIRDEEGNEKEPPLCEFHKYYKLTSVFDTPTPEERIATTTDAAIGMVLGQKETP